MVDGTAKRFTFPGLVRWHSPVLHFRCLGWIDCQHPRLDGRIIRIPSHFTSSLVNINFIFATYSSRYLSPTPHCEY